MPVRGDATLETQIGEWRAYASRRPELVAADVEELESHLRDQVETLAEAGLESDEAFLVAVKRMGALDAVSREFAQEHSERLWKQLVFGGRAADQDMASHRLEGRVAVGLAIAAAVAFKVPALFGYSPSGGAEGFYARTSACSSCRRSPRFWPGNAAPRYRMVPEWPYRSSPSRSF